MAPSPKIIAAVFYKANEIEASESGEAPGAIDQYKRSYRCISSCLVGLVWNHFCKRILR